MSMCLVANTSALRRRGLDGAQVRVALGSGTLEMHGVDGGALRLAPAAIVRLRVGYSEARRRIYEARIWERDGATPLLLVPSPETWSSYAAVMGAFARLVLEQPGAPRVEGGTSKMDAALAPILLGLVAVAATAVFVWALTEEPWWGRLIVPAMPWLIFLIVMRSAVTRWWPRPVSDPQQLRPHLPTR